MMRFQASRRRCARGSPGFGLELLGRSAAFLASPRRQLQFWTCTLAFRELLSKEFRPYATLSPEQLDLREKHFLLLQHWNRTLNLTRIDDLLENVELNYSESLFL